MSGITMNMKAGVCGSILSIVAIPVAGQIGLAKVNSSARAVTGQCMGECGRHTVSANGMNQIA